MEDGLSANGDDESDESSGYNNTLTETGGDIPNSADKMFGTYSRDFERGDSEYLTHADGLSTDISGVNQEFSIMCWVKFESLTNAQYVISKYTTSNFQYALVMEADKIGDPWACRISGDGSSNQNAVPATGGTTAAWQHVAMVYNDTDIRIYIDGSLDSNGASNPLAYTGGIFDGTHEFRVGDRNAGGSSINYKFDGLMDDVGIFDRALTSVEVSDINTNGLVGSGEPPAVDNSQVIMIM